MTLELELAEAEREATEAQESATGMDLQWIATCERRVAELRAKLAAQAPKAAALLLALGSTACTWQGPSMTVGANYKGFGFDVTLWGDKPSPKPATPEEAAQNLIILTGKNPIQP